MPSVVSIPILRVGVQQLRDWAAVNFHFKVSIPILRVGVQRRHCRQPAKQIMGFNSHTARGSSTAGICNAHFIKFLSHISADR